MAAMHAFPGAARSGFLLSLIATGALLAGCVVAPAHRAPVYSPQARGPEPAAAPPLYFYPERGQSDGQQDRDRYECYRWASAQTGVDPGMTPVRLPRGPAPMYPMRDGADVVAGAATGAVVGAAVSSRRHVGENAAIGAIFGLVLGAIAQESRAQAIERYNERQQQAHQQMSEAARVPLENFRRAMSACMEGRGYRIG
jgi:YmgG-like glycine-zipper protein